MLGFTRNSAIGVDVESLNRPFDIDKLSGFLFSDKELQKFKSSDEAHHSEHFVNCWTRKEAVLKAKGLGFTIPPNQLEVSFLNDEMPSVLSTMWAEQEQSEWFLKSLDFPGRYRGAVAVQGVIESIEVERITSLHSQVTR
jgi:4'-phosphopantetheinyl transferase